MRRIKNYLAITLVLFSAVALGDKHQASEEAEKKPSCITHTVVNESTNVTNTITRCRGEVVSDLPHKQPEPKNTDKNSKENPNAHWELINSFDDLASQKSMATSTYWLKWLTLGGLVVSLVGVGLLIYTINQNRKTFEHIKTASSLELQPYLQFSDQLDEAPPVVFISNAGKDGWLRLGLHFRIKNTGKTPARNIRNLVISSSSTVITPKEICYHSTWASLDPKKEFFIEVLFPEEECQITLYMNFTYSGGKYTGISDIKKLKNLAFKFSGAIYFDGSNLSSGGITTRRAAFAIDHNMIGGDSAFGAGYGLNMRITSDDPA